MSVRFCRLCGLDGGTLRRLKDAKGREAPCHWEAGIEPGAACVRAAARQEDKATRLEKVSSSLLHAGYEQTEIAGWMKPNAEVN